MDEKEIREQINKIERDIAGIYKLIKIAIFFYGIHICTTDLPKLIEGFPSSKLIKPVLAIDVTSQLSMEEIIDLVVAKYDDR